MINRLTNEYFHKLKTRLLWPLCSPTSSNWVRTSNSFRLLNATLSRVLGMLEGIGNSTLQFLQWVRYKRLRQLQEIAIQKDTPQNFLNSAAHVSCSREYYVFLVTIQALAKLDLFHDLPYNNIWPLYYNAPCFCQASAWHVKQTSHLTGKEWSWYLNRVKTNKQKTTTNQPTTKKKAQKETTKKPLEYTYSSVTD